MKKLTLFLFLLVGGFAHATHGGILGGDITWQCDGNGMYTFRITLFNSCDSTGSSLPDSLDITTNPNIGPPGYAIKCGQVRTTDVTPVCDPINGISCTGTNLSSIDRIEYESAPMFLAKVVPPTGIEFSTTICCRNNLTNSPTSTHFYLRAKMYAPSNVVSPVPCYDSSPTFLDIPHVLMMSNVDQNISFGDLADVDADSVKIEWATPLTLGGAPIAYSANYSFNTPLPGVIQNPNNVEGVLNEVSGHYSFNSQTTGKFATCVKQSSYRDGQLIAEVYRDLDRIILANQVISGPCQNANNDVPEIGASNLNSGTLTPTYNVLGDTMYYSISGQPGDTISLQFKAEDFEFNSDCTPQTIYFKASGAGLSLDSLYADENMSAINGNAATISSQNSNGSFDSPSLNIINFNWVLEKDHVPGTGKATYQFNFKFMDSYCVLPGQAEVALKVHVNKPFTLSIDSASICNGDSLRVEIPGNSSNLTWSPNSNIHMDSIGVYYLSPSISTLYTVTDNSSGYSETVYVNVDNIMTPTIGQSGNDFELWNANTYDSLVWTVNQMPIATPAPHDKVTPDLTGVYRIVAYKGSCVDVSNALSFTNPLNFELTPDTQGEYDGTEMDDYSFGMSIKNNQNSQLIVDYVTVGAWHDGNQNQSAKLRLIDTDQNIVFSKNSPSSVMDGMLRFDGPFTLDALTVYQLSFYFGDDVHPIMFKPFNWPVISTNNWILVANASKAPGDVSQPSAFSANFPYHHFHFNGSIGVEEFGNNEFKIYPNPAQNILNISEKGNYKVVGLDGKVLIEAKDSDIIDVSALPSGMYILETDFGKVEKFIKQ
ncbi:MAG: T9SS type A sorting domain-containing protein [Schleiferiaceae bacterium]|nr:T9SS type A sorting domain-containing protein [Schleiferiaceae bacterium]